MPLRGMRASRFPGSAGDAGERLRRALLWGSPGRTGMRGADSTGRQGLDPGLVRSHRRLGRGPRAQAGLGERQWPWDPGLYHSLSL